MTTAEYLKQINLYKGLRNTEERICGKFEIRFSHSKYTLFGEYYPKVDTMKWALFKDKVGRVPFPEYNENTPLTILRLMFEVEAQVLKKWKECEDNIWHNEEV